jgi:hypothetical protein
MASPASAKQTQEHDVPTEALAWPDWFLSPGILGRFLIDLPFVGVAARLRRHVSRTLSNRPATCLDLWGRDPYRLSVRDTVSSLIQEYFFWPNQLYIPHDPCGLLFFDPSIEMRNVEANLVLQDTYSLPEGFLDGLPEWSYGELLDRIVAHLSQAKDPPHIGS